MASRAQLRVRTQRACQPDTVEVAMFVDNLLIGETGEGRDDSSRQATGLSAMRNRIIA
jgi:hypothetical protein